ncbi:MAG: LPS assembly lipoprotein LptE [Stappiaceae bacterium]
MSLLNRSSKPAFLKSVTIGLAGLFLLGGCNIRPLYGSLPGQAPIQDELAAIDVEADQELRNELIFLLKRGGEGLPDQYRLKVTLTESSSAVSIEQLEDVPASYLVTITASFALSEIESGRTVLTGTSFSSASYDFSSQRFANLRAKRDAVTRANKSIARDLQIRLGAYFAGREKITAG